MTLFSYSLSRGRALPVEVEVVVVPGLPRIHVAGLPERALREGLIKIRSALRAQGFKFPRAKQILVNLRPAQAPKESSGLELAIAVGILAATNQVDLSKFGRVSFFGELTLDGHVLRPSDVDRFAKGPDLDGIVTGPGAAHWDQNSWEISSLSELSTPRLKPQAEVIETQSLGCNFPFQKLSVSREQARIVSIVSLTEGHTLFAGHAGTGKSTLAQVCASLRPALTDKESRELRMLAANDDARTVNYRQRPIVRPHHSAGDIALVGGGVPPRPGDVTRAHLGTLILDELMEFPMRVQDALREPLENGMITLSRGSFTRHYPARFQLIATANLCGCGKFLPRPDGGGCTCSRLMRRRCISRLSGPLLDRIQNLVFFDGVGKREVCLDQIPELVSRARVFREGRGQNLAVIKKAADSMVRAEFESIRRQEAWAKTARACADLDFSYDIKPRHWEEAWQLSVRGHRELLRAISGDWIARGLNSKDNGEGTAPRRS